MDGLRRVFGTIAQPVLTTALSAFNNLRGDKLEIKKMSTCILCKRFGNIFLKDFR